MGRRKKEVVEEIYNLAYIKNAEENYNNKFINSNLHYVKLNKFYKEYLKNGVGFGFDKDKAKEEMDRLYSFIKNDDFKNKYGREFNIVDMYLTTNLQICDICDEYLKYADRDEYLAFLFFVKKNLNKVDSINLYAAGYNKMSKKQYTARFYRPNQKGIEQLLDLDFYNYNRLDASLKDVEEAHKILLDLNEKYGVKYDDVSLYLILSTYLNGQIESYYEIAEEYKELLDRDTHVQKRCIPLLTRREINK